MHASYTESASCLLSFLSTSYLPTFSSHLLISSIPHQIYGRRQHYYWQWAYIKQTSTNFVSLKKLLSFVSCVCVCEETLLNFIKHCPQMSTNCTTNWKLSWALLFSPDFPLLNCWCLIKSPVISLSNGLQNWLLHLFEWCVYKWPLTNPAWYAFKVSGKSKLQTIELVCFSCQVKLGVI